VVGVDVGGTFTDVFALDEATGEARVAKVPTTRPDQSAGFLRGIACATEGLGRAATVVHGTTAGTNALLERKGARVGVITTRGLRDVLEMRRRDRPRTWGLRGGFVPVVPRALRLEVPERTLASGEVLEPVDVAAVEDAARALLAEGCAACAVLFANSYANPGNEARAVAAVRALWPNPHVAASAEILPEIREFERFSTTALNAYLQPEVSGYLRRLAAALGAGGRDGAERAAPGMAASGAGAEGGAPAPSASPASPSRPRAAPARAAQAHETQAHGAPARPTPAWATPARAAAPALADAPGAPSAAAPSAGAPAPTPAEAGPPQGHADGAPGSGEDAPAGTPADSGAFLVVQSSGGLMSVDTACRLPMRTALSGPAAGVTAAAHIAREAGFPDVITGDVGGTSFDVSLVAGGRPAQAAQTSIDFGLVIRAPMIEIATIGAGGGSIASVDRGGLLAVGPASAGSDPGPASYGRGNDRPTVTDANVVLGRIDPDAPMGGMPALDAEAAGRAVEAHVGGPLGLGRMDAAEAVLAVAEAAMAGALRLVSIERGHDPARFAYMPFGGGGGLHVCAMLREVGIGRALVPRHPGVTSALGCVIADMRHDFVQTLNLALEAVDADALASLVAAHEAEGGALLDRAGVRLARRETRVELDMAYAGQTHAVAVPVAPPFTPARIAEAFDATYAAAYGRLLAGGARRVVSLRTAVIGHRPKFDLATLEPRGGSLEAARRGARTVRFAGEARETALFERLALPVGAVIEGPAILSQPDATILVEPGFAARTDRLGNTVLERG
jgi:N-methylhydantoinase A/oxoprolinase/acetone carboxylase beta subunit